MRSLHASRHVVCCPLNRCESHPTRVDTLPKKIRSICFRWQAKRDETIVSENDCLGLMTSTYCCRWRWWNTEQITHGWSKDLLFFACYIFHHGIQAAQIHDRETFLPSQKLATKMQIAIVGRVGVMWFSVYAVNNYDAECASTADTSVAAAVVAIVTPCHLIR